MCRRMVTMEESSSSRALLISSVSALSERIVNVVGQVRKYYKTSSDLYAFIKLDNRRGVSALYAVSYAYSDCFKAVGVQTRAELEQLWSRHYSDPQVRDAVEVLLEGEESFTELLTEVERELIPCEEKSVANGPAAVGQLLPGDLTLLDVSSGQHSMIEEYWKGSKFTLFVVVRHFG